MRKPLAIASTVLLAGSVLGVVAACSSSSGSSSGSSSASASSSPTLVTTNLTASEVTVTGTGQNMTVEFPHPSSASKLSTKDIKVGTGSAATQNSKISASYVLKGAISGNVLDQGTLPPTAVGGFIPGFSQGIVGMKVGGQRTIVIPGPLGYGATPPSPEFQPNETLVFVVQMLAVT